MDLILNIIKFGVLISSLGDAITLPSFPPEAAKRGISQFQIGLVLGVHPIFCILLNIWLGNNMIKF